MMVSHHVALRCLAALLVVASEGQATPTAEYSLSPALSSVSASVLINNIAPRYAHDGVTIMDAHDGSTTRFGGPGSPYFYYAMGYGLCTENGEGADSHCGQLSNNTVGVWSSRTLESGSWTLQSSFMPSSPESGWPNCTYYRSHAVRRVVPQAHTYSSSRSSSSNNEDNNTTSGDTGTSSQAAVEYVLYLNGQAGLDNECAACPEGSHSKCILAGTSSSPTGPFTYKGVVPLRYTDEGGIGDFDVFVDEVASGGGRGAHGDAGPAWTSERPPPAYVLYKRSGAAPPPFSHRMTLQQLDDSYLGVVANGSAGLFGAPFVEAPALFRRGETLYALFGKCCAFCAHVCASVRPNEGHRSFLPSPEQHAVVIACFTFMVWWGSRPPRVCGRHRPMYMYLPCLAFVTCVVVSCLRRILIIYYLLAELLLLLLLMLLGLMLVFQQ